MVAKASILAINVIYTASSNAIAVTSDERVKVQSVGATASVKSIWGTIGQCRDPSSTHDWNDIGECSLSFFCSTIGVGMADMRYHTTGNAFCKPVTYWKILVIVMVISDHRTHNWINDVIEELNQSHHAPTNNAAVNFVRPVDYYLVHD